MPGTLVVIAGPTASGKSAVAVAQVPAEYMRTEGSLVAAYNTGALVVEPNHVCCVTVS